MLILTSCGNSKYSIPYSADSDISSFSVESNSKESARADSFASKLCVSESNQNNSDINISGDVSAALFDVSNANTLYAKNIHESMYPASLTKIMTAIVALKNGTPDMILTASNNVKISDTSAQVLGLKAGDQMTLEQALNVLLIYSANDVAILIAEGIGGSVEDFVNMMNAEAMRIGATHTNFVNPHGLSDEEHYTTLYDLYLMTNEAIQYDMFNRIINTAEYEFIYYDAAGNAKETKVSNTNLYLTGEHSIPSGVTIIGGKTGTTNAAGHCLILVSKDHKQNKLISIIMKSESREDMYTFTDSMLQAAVK